MINIIDINTIKDLQKFGNIEKIKKELDALVAPLRVSSESYDDLLDVIVKLKEKWIDFVPGPFVSERAELIYYFTKLEGKQRNNALGITDEHYENKAVAKKWFKSISQKIHSDKGGNDEAFKVLKSLYEVMIDDNFGGDNE